MVKRCPVLLSARENKMFDRYYEEETMTKKQLLEKLKKCVTADEPQGHVDADEFLLEYIDDEEITRTFRSICRWYD